MAGGALGDFDGSVGNVTFARARGGIRTARRRAHPGNPRSPAQQRQRGRFKQIQRFASAFLAAGLVRPFWRPYATGGLSAYNAFVRANAAAMPDGLDPAAAVIAQGNGLAPVALASIEADPGDSGYTLTFASAAGDPDDLLVGLLYNARAFAALMVDTGATRGGAVEVAAPAAWAGEDADALYAYGFAYRVGGAGGLLLSDSAARKVTAAPYAVPPSDVPAAAVADEAPYGQRP